MPDRFQPPRLGPGAVLFRAFEPLFRSRPDLIRVAEVEPQTLWTRATAPDAPACGSALKLAEIASLPQRVLLHGIGSPVGGTLCHGEREQAEFTHWARRLGSPWTSEHLSILEVEGRDEAGLPATFSCGFLMPPAQTEAQVALAAQNIRRRTRITGLPFAFETGTNYFAPRPGEMPDGAFLAAVAEEADCGILLDLANLWVNALNGRPPVAEVLRHLPPERIWEVHLSGPTFSHGRWLDGHAGAIPPDLVAMAGEVVAGLPNLGAITFEVAPDRMAAFGEAAFLRQMEVLHAIWERTPPAFPTGSRPRSRRTTDGEAPTMPNASGLPSPTEWEQLIASRMLPPPQRPPPPVVPTDEDATFAMYRDLVVSAREGALADMLENTVRLLLLALGEDGTRAVMGAYIDATPPALFPSDEALSFADFMLSRTPSVPGLASLLAFEAALVRAVADDGSVRVRIDRDIEHLLTDVAAGRIPAGEGVGGSRAQLVEIGSGPLPSIRVIGTVEA